MQQYFWVLFRYFACKKYILIFVAFVGLLYLYFQVQNALVVLLKGRADIWRRYNELLETFANQ